MAARLFGPVCLSVSGSIICCFHSLMFSSLSNWETVPQRQLRGCACKGGRGERGRQRKIEVSVHCLLSVRVAFCSTRPPHSLSSATESI